MTTAAVKILQERVAQYAQTPAAAGLNVAVLVPCYNEATTIAQVVADFKAALPGATVYVYDNNSSDQTAAVAKAAGAVVRLETLQGKGNVVRRMFADIQADVYILVDGDATYDAPSAPAMVASLLEGPYDMVNGARITTIQAAYRPGHRFGNVLLTSLVAGIFGNRFTDMLSGYRVFSRRYVKSFPALAQGFEIETELTVHALKLRMPCIEVKTPYLDRPVGSVSKLNTFRDGFRILALILKLVKDENPLPFFAGIGALFAATGLILAFPVFTHFLETGMVPRLPTAILATGLMLLASLSLMCGLILDTVTRGRLELKRMLYLRFPAATAPFQTTPDTTSTLL